MVGPLVLAGLLSREYGVEPAQGLFVQVILEQGISLFHDTAACGFGLDVRAVKLSDRCLVEGSVNRAKDPLIRVADSCQKALVRLAVDIEKAWLAAALGPPPMRLIVEHSAERHADEVGVSSDSAEVLSRGD